MAGHVCCHTQVEVPIVALINSPSSNIVLVSRQHYMMLSVHCSYGMLTNTQSPLTLVVGMTSVVAEGALQLLLLHLESAWHVQLRAPHLTPCLGAGSFVFE